MSYPLIRRYTTSPGQKLTPQILQLQGNPNDVRGGGGTCFGDSGGPVFLNGYLVGVTSYTYTSNCRYLGGYQRVDIAVVQNWLDSTCRGFAHGIAPDFSVGGDFSLVAYCLARLLRQRFIRASALTAILTPGECNCDRAWVIAACQRASL